MRLLALLAVLLLAGCLAGPNRVSGFTETCPSWTEGQLGGGVGSQISPREGAMLQFIDFTQANKSRDDWTPLRVPETKEIPRNGNPVDITLDRLVLKFESERGNFVATPSSELTVHFTHAGPSTRSPITRDEAVNGRTLPFIIVGLPEGSNGNGGFQAFDSFTFTNKLYTDFSIQIYLDAENGDADPGGVFAIWDYVSFDPSGPISQYSYDWVGLYDRCEN